MSATDPWVLCVLNLNVWFWFLFGLQSLELWRQRALGSTLFISLIKAVCTFVLSLITPPSPSPCVFCTHHFIMTLMD